MEVLVVWRRHGFEAEVIDDEQRCCDDIVEAPLEGICGPCRVELSQQLGLCGEQHIVACSDGEVSEGLCDVAFARAAGTGDENRDLFFDEGTGGQVLDECLIDGGVEGEVEAFEGFLAAEARASQAEVELFVFPACDLVLDEQGEELTVSEFVVDGFLVSGRQGLEDAGQSQSFEQGCKFRHRVHCVVLPFLLAEEGCGVAAETSLSRIGCREAVRVCGRLCWVFVLVQAFF